MNAAVKRVSLPELSKLEPEPCVSDDVYVRRQERLRARMRDAGIEILAVYADREHSANASYLTGFDPRFEEALVLLSHEGAIVIAGNESISLVPGLPGAPIAVLCQAFSLPGQDRSVCATLEDALVVAGVAQTASLGVVGWKPMASTGSGRGMSVPGFVIDGLTAHLRTRPIDLTDWLCGLDGARTEVEADQIALHEHRATRASGHVWRALEALAPGRSELELTCAMQLTGLPQACHVMCTSGADTVNGLRSPGDRVLGYGDRFSVAVGLWGGLCSRAGRLLTHDDPELAAHADGLIAPYVAAQRQWYESLRIGADAGEITRNVVARLAERGLRPLLNPGHFVHLDEWVHSPFTVDSQVRLRSGMALQCDIIPVGPDPGAAANCEDSLAIADSDLRAELRERFPTMWTRVLARREFMESELGIALGPEVLPLSDRQGALPAGLLSLEYVVDPEG
ncbi:MAG: M24 family metallopeptidase [Solirubrobacteraceae bacterium]